MNRFTLQTALDVRSRQEKIRMKELAEKLVVERNIIQQIDDIMDNTAKAESGLNSSKESRTITIDHLRFLNDFKDRMKVVLADCYIRLEAAKQEVHEKQQMLIEASKAKKTLEIFATR